MDDDVYQEIIRLFNREMRPGEVLARLDADPRYRSRRPEIRTIKYIRREWTPRERSERWSLRDANSPAEARLVLPVLAAVAAETDGRRLHLTVAEAAWVARICEAVPDVPPWDAYVVARMYLRAAASDEDTRGLDLYLADAPWRDPQRNERVGDLWREKQRYETVDDVIAREGEQ